MNIIKIRKFLPILGVIALAVSAHPCFAENQQQICLSAKDLINSTNTYSYKATGRIYFLKKCPDKEELCKTGSYIIAGDYFIAVPKVNGYYCAAYIPNGYTRPKSVGLIKGENFTETKPEEYKELHYEATDNGSWQEVHNKDYPTTYNCTVGGSFALQTAPDKIPYIAINGESDFCYKGEEHYEMWGPEYMDTMSGVILKVGDHSYIASVNKAANDDLSILYIRSNRNRLILESFDEPVAGYQCPFGGNIYKYDAKHVKYEGN